MPPAEPGPTTRLLNRFGAGEAGAAEELAPIVYDELHRMAERLMQGHGGGHTLQPTALVSEAWMRLSGGADERSFAGRARFFALAGRVLRSVLVDHARARGAEKRGGDRQRITLSEHEGPSSGDAVDVLALDEALERLKEMDPQLHRLVELRFFGGLTNAEVAGLLRSSLRSVERQWRLARAWLRGELA